MAGTITIRTDDETEHALEVLTHDGNSRSAAIRQAVLEAASDATYSFGQVPQLLLSGDADTVIG